MYSGDTDLLLLLLLLVHLLLLAGTHFGTFTGMGPHICWKVTKTSIDLLKPIQMHYAVSDVVLQQEAHV